MITLSLYIGSEKTTSLHIDTDIDMGALLVESLTSSPRVHVRQSRARQLGAALMMQDSYALAYYYIKDVICVTKEILQNLTPDQIRLISEILPPFQNIHIDIYRLKDHRGISRYGPKLDLSTTSFREYCLLSDLLQKYSKGDELSLYKLSEVLFRPRHKEKTVRLTTGDERSPIPSDAIIDRRATRSKMDCSGWRRWIYSDHNALLLHGISVHTAIRTKELVHKKYHKHMFSNESSGKSKGIDIGWHGIAIDIADANGFGTIEEVYDMPFLRIITYLIKKKTDYLNLQTANEV